jgi:hypothetical protein
MNRQFLSLACGKIGGEGVQPLQEWLCIVIPQPFCIRYSAGMKTRMPYPTTASESFGSNARSDRRMSEGANLLVMLVAIIVVYVFDFLKLAPLLYTGIALALVGLFTMPQQRKESGVKSFCCLVLFFVGLGLSFYALVQNGTINWDALKTFIFQN